MTHMQTPIWQLIGLVSSSPGLLTLGEGFLCFETAEGTQFRCPVSQIRDVKWPWYSFSCALNLNASGTKYRFSFARPNGAAAAWRPVSAVNNIFDLGRAAKTGKAWKKELADQTRT
jgi:hypothetical protein